MFIVKTLYVVLVWISQENSDQLPIQHLLIKLL